METSVEQLVSAARSGGPLGLRAAARLMSVMTDEPQRLAELLAGSRDWPQPRLVLGITGAPGSGKSTLTDHLAIDYRLRYPDSKLGIVAVDPSSPFTGGALLGDRVRMMRHSTDPNVFIRSLASRGHLGGLALGAKGVVRVMGLIGCDVVIVETVGVGQSEVEIAKNADMVIVVLAPGQGDSVQMLKAGLMEAGDMFVINKADRPEAAQLYQQLLSTLQTSHLAQLDLANASIAVGCHSESTSPSPEYRGGGLDVPPVLLTSATNHEGLSALATGEGAAST
jgi:LAO/AO transport system kinase